MGTRLLATIAENLGIYKGIAIPLTGITEEMLPDVIRDQFLLLQVLDRIDLITDLSLVIEVRVLRTVDHIDLLLMHQLELDRMRVS